MKIGKKKHTHREGSRCETRKKKERERKKAMKTRTEKKNGATLSRKREELHKDTYKEGRHATWERRQGQRTTKEPSKTHL